LPRKSSPESGPLTQRRRFGDLVAAADLVFVVLDQPAATFFALDACNQHRKLTVTGGTCVLSGLMAQHRTGQGTRQGKGDFHPNGTPDQVYKRPHGSEGPG
jgi:hypothetical protein